MKSNEGRADDRSVRLMAKSDRGVWDDFVLKNGHSSCYHLSVWKDIIEQTFGHKTFYLLSEDETGQVNGILPLITVKSLLFGRFAVSMPYFNYGGVCSDSAWARDNLLNEAVRLCRRERLAHLELRHCENVFQHLPVKMSKISMKLRLKSNADLLWNSFPSKLRSQIRRPSKEGMYTRAGGLNELDAFYDVFSRNMRDLGTPVYGKAFFKNILIGLGNNAIIHTVYTSDGQPVASGFLIVFKRTVEIPWASSLRRFNRFSPNSLLYWEVLKYGCEGGYETFDFGRSTPGEGTHRFKEQWGATPEQLYWHYWLKEGLDIPELNPHNPSYRRAINLWKRLPLSLTRLVGPSLVKNLP